MTETNLSRNARLLLGSSFSFGQVLTYHMVESVPSPEMQDALDELVASGHVTRETGLHDMTAKAVRYRAADGIDLMPFKREFWDSIERNDAPSIRVFVKKGEQ